MQKDEEDEVKKVSISTPLTQTDPPSVPRSDIEILGSSEKVSSILKGETAKSREPESQRELEQQGGL